MIFVVTQDVGALGSIEKAREGSPGPYEQGPTSRPQHLRRSHR